MYKIVFLHSDSFEIGLHSHNKFLVKEMSSTKFSKKVYWLPTRLSTENLFHQSYFSSLIEDLKNDAYIIYSIASEPGKISWVDELLNPLIKVFKENNISLKKLIVLSATPASQYGKCEYKYMFFNDQLYDTIDRYKTSGFVAQPKNLLKHYLCLSRKDTLARRYVNYLIHTKKLYDKGIVSHGRGFSPIDPDISDLEKARSDYDFFHTYELNVKDYLKYGFKKHFLDTENMSKLSEYQILYMYNFDIHFNHSKSIPLEIVNETNAFGHDSLYITEKMLKAILARNIFLVVGNPHILSFLQQLGFKTFSHLFDESYDAELDNVKRTNIVFKNLEDFCKIPMTDCKKIYDENAELLDYNYNHLLNKSWNFSIRNRIEKYITKASCND
tara:strand:- start:2723 stop:3877 length:1155 start_codon:yes stop_codon:yes gene_type:complete